MKANESERLTPLQSLLLAFIEQGLATPYDLLTRAGLGVGLTSPALKRLKQEGMLTCAGGPRKSLRYALTEKGESALRETLDAGPAVYLQHWDVFESLPRAVILAWVHSGSDEAHDVVRRALESLSMCLWKKARDVEELSRSLSGLQADISSRKTRSAKGHLVATAYRWLKGEYDATLLRLQEDAVRQLDSLIERLPTLLHEAEAKKRM